MIRNFYYCFGEIAITIFDFLIVFYSKIIPENIFDYFLGKLVIKN
jgi:hypothetical protein